MITLRELIEEFNKKLPGITIQAWIEPENLFPFLYDENHVNIWFKYSYRVYKGRVKEKELFPRSKRWSRELIFTSLENKDGSLHPVSELGKPESDQHKWVHEELVKFFQNKLREYDLTFDPQPCYYC